MLHLFRKKSQSNQIYTKWHAQVLNFLFSQIIIYEPSRDKRDISVMCLVLLQMGQHSHPLDLISGSVSETSSASLNCVWTAMALARLCGCIGLPEPLVFVYVISNLFSWDGSYLYVYISFSYSILFSSNMGWWRFYQRDIRIYPQRWLCVVPGSIWLRYVPFYRYISFVVNFIERNRY